MRSIRHRNVLNLGGDTPSDTVITIPVDLLSLGARAVQVYAVLEAFPRLYPHVKASTRVLCSEVDCSANTLRKALDVLVIEGWIYRYDTKNRYGGHDVPLYVVNAAPFDPLTRQADGWVRLNIEDAATEGVPFGGEARAS